MVCKMVSLSPVTTINPVKDGWYNRDLKLSLGSTDNLSGVATTQYKINDGDWLTYNNGITISDEGNRINCFPAIIQAILVFEFIVNKRKVDEVIDST